jgi:hypothetical protein
MTNNKKTTPPATPPPIAPALVDLDVDGNGPAVVEGPEEPVGSDRVMVGLWSIVVPVEVAVTLSDIVVVAVELAIV